MKTTNQLPIEFSLGHQQFKGTLEKKKGKENEIYFHTVFNGEKYRDIKFAADFYPIKINLLNHTLIKWECKSENIRESFKYPAAAAIEKLLRESHIPVF
jgi:hypothetical protein